MKIAIFTQRWVTGGKESYLINNFEKMSISGLEITILTSIRETDFFDEKLDELGINIIELTKRNCGPFTRPLYLINGLIKHLKGHSYEAIHLNIDNGVGLYFAKIANKYGIPRIIAHSHNSDTGGGFGRPLKLVSHYVCKKMYMNYPTDYWACSDFAAKWLFSNDIFNNNRYIFMKNAIDIKKVKFDEIGRKNFRAEISVKSDEYLVGTIGRISQQKNQTFLLDVFSKVLKEDNKIKLLIVGDGELLEELIEKSKQLKISENIIFYGKTSNIQGALSAMDLFVLPSHFEGFPLSVIEAQANGLPLLISQSVTKMVKLIQSVDFLSTAKNEDEWANAIVARSENHDRGNYSDFVHIAGYDLNDSAQHLRLNFLNKN